MLLCVALGLPLLAQDMTANRLFDLVEARSDQINSLIAEVVMYPGPEQAGFPMTLSIQSPDRFAMDFGPDGVHVVFSGEKLWIHVPTLREVFVADLTTSGGWLSEFVRNWVNPKQMITRMTRYELMTFFDVKVLLTDPRVIPPNRHEVGGVPLSPQTAAGAACRGAPGWRAGPGEPAQNASFTQGNLPVSASGSVAAGSGVVDPGWQPRVGTSTYLLGFVPHTTSVFRRWFGIGSYTMAFDRTTFLPTAAWEFASDGTPRGRLEVRRYHLNQPIPRETFVFVPASDTRVVPLVDVVIDKVDEGADLLGRGVDLLLNRLRSEAGGGS